LKRLTDCLLYLGFDRTSLLKRKIRQLGLHHVYPLDIFRTYVHSFDHVEEWYLMPEELDFREQTLGPLQRYAPIGIDMQRREEKSQDLLDFVALKAENKFSKLVYFL